jgi:hypothetical protein
VSASEAAFLFFMLIMHVVFGVVVTRCYYLKIMDEAVEARVHAALRGREAEVEEYGRQCLCAGRELGANEMAARCIHQAARLN